LFHATSALRSFSISEFVREGSLEANADEELEEEDEDEELEEEADEADEVAWVPADIVAGESRSID